MNTHQQIEDAMKVNQPHLWKIACAAILLSLVTAIAASAQTFTTLASFTSTTGAPSTALVQGLDGNLYGLTASTFFKVTPTGTLTVLHTFCAKPPCTVEPGSLIRGGDGNFYGVTEFDDGNTSSKNCPDGCGTVFKVAATGGFTTLYKFCSLANCADGFFPLSLMQSSNSGGGSVYGDFYGTTVGGVDNGTVFRLTPAGQLTSLATFSNNAWLAGQLIQTASGNFYGAQANGSDPTGDCLAGNCGGIFRMTPTGTVTQLQVFSGPTNPVSPLVQYSDGSFYGMTLYGPSSGCGRYGCGMIFKISSAGTLTTLHTFCSEADCMDGSSPFAGLILGTDGNFYGTTGGNGNDCPDGLCPGNIFVMTPSGTLTSLYNFCAGQLADTACPGSSGSGLAMVQSTNGKFYGLAQDGGSNNVGAVFSLDVGLAPFVTFLTSVGPVGKAVQILGQGFTGATAVSFNGTPAAFTIKSDTFITTSVPAGATTGLVTVTTPSGTLASNVVYRVQP